MISPGACSTADRRPPLRTASWPTNRRAGSTRPIVSSTSISTPVLAWATYKMITARRDDAPATSTLRRWFGPAVEAASTGPTAYDNRGGIDEWLEDRAAGRECYSLSPNSAPTVRWPCFRHCGLKTKPIIGVDRPSRARLDSVRCSRPRVPNGGEPWFAKALKSSARPSTHALANNAGIPCASAHH